MPGHNGLGRQRLGPSRGIARLGRGRDAPCQSNPKRERHPRSPPYKGQLSTKQTDGEARGHLGNHARAVPAGRQQWDVTWGQLPHLEGWASPTARGSGMVTQGIGGVDHGIHDTRAQPSVRPGDALQKWPCSHSLPGQVRSWLPPCLRPVSVTQQHTGTATSGRNRPQDAYTAVGYAFSSGETDDTMPE